MASRDNNPMLTEDEQVADDVYNEVGKGVVQIVEKTCANKASGSRTHVSSEVSRTRVQQKNAGEKFPSEQLRIIHEIDSLTVETLRNRLKRLGLPATGKQSELRNRLISYIENVDEEVTKTGETVDESDSTDMSGVDEPDEIDESENESDKEVQQHPQREVQVNSRYGHDNASRNMFTIKDVEDSIAHFSGDNELSIEKWTTDFEDLAALLKWDDLQKLIYAKRLMQGSAKQFITYEKNVISWDVLKRRLKREFKTKINSASIHAQLARRKRRNDESSRQYVHAMLEIASQDIVEEDALIQYVVDGIQNEEANKCILYTASSLSSLKKKLEIYDRMKDRTSRKKAFKKENEKYGKNDSKNIKPTPTTKKQHCFFCGSVEHDVKQCPFKDKGPKCFKCNTFGHIATKCTEAVTTPSEKTNVRCISTMTPRHRRIAVDLVGVRFEALVDTGSDATVMTEIIYEKIGSLNLRQTSRILTGLGNKLTTPIGVFTSSLVIDSQHYETEMFVVPTEVLTSCEILIGYELLRDVDFHMRRGIVKITSLPREDLPGAARPDRIIPIENEIKTPIESCLKELEDNPSDIFNSEDLLNINCIVTNEIDTRKPYKKKIEELIGNYKPNAGIKASVETKIILKSEDPVCQKPRRLAAKEKKILDEQITEWLKAGVIRPSKSTYSRAVVIVPKKDGSYRICIDYRQLNRKIIRDRFPMPLIEDCIDSLSNAKVFSTLDLKNGFFHVPVAEDSRKYTSFVTPDGQFEFIKTPFGLCNSPSSFLRFVEEVFRDLIRQKVVLTYMDDLIVPGINEDDASRSLLKC